MNVGLCDGSQLPPTCGQPNLPESIVPDITKHFTVAVNGLATQPPWQEQELIHTG